MGPLRRVTLNKMQNHPFMQSAVSCVSKILSARVNLSQPNCTPRRNKAANAAHALFLTLNGLDGGRPVMKSPENGNMLTVVTI